MVADIFDFRFSIFDFRLNSNRRGAEKKSGIEVLD